MASAKNAVWQDMMNYAVGDVWDQGQEDVNDEFACICLQFMMMLIIMSAKELIIMANTSAVYARIDSNLKEKAESILGQLGIAPSAAIQMLYSQIVLTRSMPLDLRLPARKPTAIGTMSNEQIDAELEKGVASLQNGRVYSPEEVDAILLSEFNI